MVGILLEILVYRGGWGAVMLVDLDREMGGKRDVDTIGPSARGAASQHSIQIIVISKAANEEEWD